MVLLKSTNPQIFRDLHPQQNILKTTQTIFPQYRKYKGDHTFFRIDSEREFTELKRMGGFFSYTHTQAQQYNELLFIIDLLELRSENFFLSDREEFERTKQNWECHLKMIQI